MLDTRQYDVELEDDTMDRIFTNKIAANIYSQAPFLLGLNLNQSKFRPPEMPFFWV